MDSTHPLIGVDADSIEASSRCPVKRHGHPDFYKTLEEMANLHDRKNHDYAASSDPLSNLRLCERVGIPAYKGVFVRLGDKFSRLEQLIGGKDPMVKGESVEDTLMDQAVYSILCLILYREAKKANKVEVDYEKLQTSKASIEAIPF